MLKMFKSVTFLITPVLATVFPILSFYVHNISDLAPKFLEKPLIYSVTISVIFTLIIYAISKNRQKSALIATSAIFIFFSYGHLSKYLNDKFFISLPKKVVLGPDKVLLPLVLLTFTLLVFKIIKSKKNIPQSLKLY